MLENIKLLRGRVLVREDKENEAIRGIVIPDISKQRTLRGVIVSIGLPLINKGGIELPIEIRLGDEVIYGEYSGFPIEIGGEEYYIMLEDEIYGKEEGLRGIYAEN